MAPSIAMTWFVALCTVVLAVGCGGASGRPVTQQPAPETQRAAAPPEAATPVKLDIDSADILARTDASAGVQVKHVLFGWAELADVYASGQDPRAAARTQAEAAQLAILVSDRLRLNPALIDAMIDQYSEDPGRRDTYTVTPDAGLVPEFKALSLRLRPSEVGVVKTKWGYHVIVRVDP